MSRPLPVPSPADHALPRAERSRRTHLLFASLDLASCPQRRAEVHDELVRLNLRVATAVAARYRGRGVEDDDLQQAASHGLVKAVQRFDLAQGKDFLTYAVPTIRGEVQRHFRDASWTVRPPRRVQELQWRVTASVDRLSGELGREPVEQEVLDDLGIAREEYAEVVTAFGCFRPPSLDQHVPGTDGLVLGDRAAVEDPGLAAAEARAVLQPLLRALSPRDRRVLHLRFVEDHTQQQIADELGVTQMQVSRLLARILGQLRTAVSEPSVPAIALAG